MKQFVFLTSLLAFSLLSSVLADEDEKGQKAVLITGATTGIGRVAAEHLAAQGYFVYAGARKDADIKELNKIDNVMAVRIDVTKQDQVDEAVRIVQEQGRGLWGLVNNAGVGVLAPILAASQEDIRFVFDVNVFGVYRVTQAFAPMILESHGRIVNVSSISGTLSNPTAGVYAGSKHAIEAMTDALAMELQPFGVHVAAVNPGDFASAIGMTRCRRFLEDKATDWGIFEDDRLSMLAACKEMLKPGYVDDGLSPNAVALAIEQALFEKSPRGHYLVASQGGAGETIAWAIREMLALNIGHEQSYTRDEIVQFIDAMWPYMSGDKSWDTLDDEWELHEDWSERRLSQESKSQ